MLGCDLVIYNDLEDIVEAVRSCNPVLLKVYLIFLPSPFLLKSTSAPDEKYILLYCLLTMTITF